MLSKPLRGDTQRGHCRIRSRKKGIFPCVRPGIPYVRRMEEIAMKLRPAFLKNLAVCFSCSHDIRLFLFLLLGAFFRSFFLLRLLLRHRHHPQFRYIYGTVAIHTYNIFGLSRKKSSILDIFFIFIFRIVIQLLFSCNLRPGVEFLAIFHHNSNHEEQTAADWLISICRSARNRIYNILI